MDFKPSVSVLFGHDSLPGQRILTKLGRTKFEKTREVNLTLMVLPTKVVNIILTVLPTKVANISSIGYT